jgi:UDP-glucose 4-epimerase
MKKILVSGGAGFIGSHLVEALVQAGHSVRVLDDFSSGRRDNLRSVRADVDVLKGQCERPEDARRAVRGVDVVYHEAAVPSVALSVTRPVAAHAANATATMVLLTAARDAGVERFFYAGSSSVYGDRRERFKREDLPTKPLSPYGVAKLCGENYVRLFSELYGMKTLTLRYFNVFGPRQDPSSPYSGVISRFCTAALAGERPTIYGDGLQSRDFTYVENVVNANLRALSASGLRGQTVNVATGRAISLRTLWSQVARLSGSRVAPRREAARPGDIRHSLADISAARRVLGYRPSVDFATGLRRTYDWYRSSARAV